VIDILIPSLGRPSVLADLIENIEQVTPTDAYTIWFVLDREDTESMVAVSGRDVEVVLHGGTYPVKINAGYRVSSGDLVLPTADDVVFHAGWLEAALNALSDSTVQVLGTDDLSPATANRDHATMPITRRSYIEDPGAAWGETGTIFHEGYRHNFVETETWQLALHRGVIGWATDCVIEHLHPAWGKREADETDRKGNLQGWEQDEALFRRRQREWLRS
jgi:hypothetical protein